MIVLYYCTIFLYDIHVRYCFTTLLHDFALRHCRTILLYHMFVRYLCIILLHDIAVLLYPKILLYVNVLRFVMRFCFTKLMNKHPLITNSWPRQSCWLMPITDIALIGDFTKTEPSEVAQQSLNKLFLCGISSHMLRRTSRLIVAPFRCGRAFYEMFDSCQCFCDYELE